MGDTVLFMPGDEVPVEILERDGDLPDRGDVVEITGENAQFTEVQPIGAEGDVGFGIVTDLASDEDGNAVEGPGTVLASKTVAVVNESTDGDVSAGDEVQEDEGGGVVVFADAGTNTETPLGQAFAAHAGKYGFGKGNKVAVALYR